MTRFCFGVPAQNLHGSMQSQNFPILNTPAPSTWDVLLYLALFLTKRRIIPYARIGILSGFYFQHLYGRVYTRPGYGLTTLPGWGGCDSGYVLLRIADKDIMSIAKIRAISSKKRYKRTPSLRGQMH